MFTQADLVPVLLFVIIAVFSRFQHKEEGDELSIENSTMLKGFLSLSVVLCHLALYYGQGAIINCFTFLGNISVGVFFFISGYALMIQYLKRSDYHIGFLRKRFVKILIPYLIVTLLYLCYFNLIGEKTTLSEALILFVKGHPIARYSWYIAEVMVFYLFFDLSMITCKEKWRLLILMNLVFYFCLMAFYRFFDYSSCWYYSSHMYVIGLLYASNKEKLSGFLKKYSFLCFVSSILFLLMTGEKSFFFSRIAYLMVF